MSWFFVADHRLRCGSIAVMVEVVVVVLVVVAIVVGEGFIWGWLVWLHLKGVAIVL